MFGEIFGLMAGDINVDEDMLDRFFDILPPLPSARATATGLATVGDATLLSNGLGLEDRELPGVLCGPSFGVFLALIRGVACSSGIAVSTRDSVGRVVVAGDGRTRSSITACSGAAGSPGE